MLSASLRGESLSAVKPMRRVFGQSVAAIVEGFEQGLEVSEVGVIIIGPEVRP